MMMKQSEAASAKERLKIMGVAIQRPAPVPEAEAARGVQERFNLAIEVENPSNKPLYVWASRRAYDYDPTTHVLTLYLTEQTPALPPGIKLISDHPRTPKQVVVDAKGHATIDVPVPTIIRHRVPGEGLGMSFIEEPIGSIDRVDLHIQLATEPVAEHLVEESPTAHHERLRAHGDVVQVTITPTKIKE